MTTYLLKPGELTLKSGNRNEFESILKRNIVATLRGTGAQLVVTEGRLYIRCNESAEDNVENILRRLIGISGWAKTKVAEKNMDAVLSACIEEARLLYGKGIKTFKIEARRTDKSFPVDSYEIKCTAGEAVRKEIPEMTVDVKNPQGVIVVEIREKAFIYADANEGLRGLPCGSSARGLLLLSGGIDSPVAGFMMATRGMRLEAVYFHAWPYTSAEAKDKTITLAGILGSYCMGVRLFIIGFTEVENRIKERAPESWRTVLLRMAMMECAEKLARIRGNKCLVSGESLAQVASQTIENISCTQSTASLPVLRPLIGMDKDQIIRIAKKIGTYETSILPYEDCCILFSPPHPILRGNIIEATELYASLEAEDLIDAALDECESIKCGYPLKK